MPQEDRHDHAVAGNDRRPHPAPFEPTAHRGTSEHDERDLEHGEHEQARRRRRHVRDLGAGQADHAVRVRAERRQCDERSHCRTGHRREPRARQAQQRTVGVEEAELLCEQPHEQQVEVTDTGGTVESDDVDRDRCDRQDREHVGAEARVQRAHDRRERGDHQVRADEPQRLAHDARGLSERVIVDAGGEDHDRERDPHREQRDDRPQ